MRRSFSLAKVSSKNPIWLSTSLCCALLLLPLTALSDDFQRLPALSLLTLERVLLGANVVAEKYRLANTGAAALTLHEPDLHKRGVMAVSVERASLQPGEATPVFVIRERRSND